MQIHSPPFQPFIQCDYYVSSVCFKNLQLQNRISGCLTQLLVVSPHKQIRMLLKSHWTPFKA